MTIEEAFHIALQHHQAGRLAEAEALYRQILAVAPQQADVQHLLGVLAHQVGRSDLAVEMIGKAIAMRPNEGVYHSNLGEAYRELGRTAEAMASYRRAIQLKPDHAEAWGNLGNVLAHLCRADEAVEACRRAVELKPGFVEGHYNLANALKMRGDLAGAEVAYRRTLALRPDYWKAHTNLGAVLKDQRRLGEAIAQFRRSIECKPDDAPVWNNLGTAWIDRGEFAKAIAAYRKAIELKPDDAEIHGNLLLALHYGPDLSPEEVFREHRLWGELHTAPLARAAAPHANPPDPERRLRIGYVSPDFREHSVAFFVEGLLACHDRSQFEPVCYSNLLVEDEVTARLRGLVPAWRGILDKKDAEVAELIWRDGIDILVDLTGHTAHNRLSVFARKPAPVQVTWLGYCGTTGMKEIDYRITDAHADPPGTTDQWHTETLIRLPETFACFRPADSSPPVGPLPAAARGGVTFGSFHMLAKLNEPHLAHWAEILKAVPGSRLLMVATGLDEKETQARFLAIFARHGIEAARIEFRGRMALVDYLALHQRVDVMLDCHPFTGHTVACHALWMGVPVVTLAGVTHCSRMVTSVVKNLGRPEWSAATAEEFVRIAIALASDLPRLAEIRAGLRASMAASPLTDAARFAKNVEQAYREMWRAWCKTREGAA